MRIQTTIAHKISPQGRIVGGPFQNMIYNGDGEGLGSSILPKLVGSYEEELHSCIDTILMTSYGTVIDIGCDDGYYAVGLALKMPTTRVIAYDVNPVALARCATLAHRNRVADRMVIIEGCSSEQLRITDTRAACLILSDCEGAEHSLLHPSTIPTSALQCDLLIETHDSPNQPNMAETLIERFRATHDPTIISGSPRISAKYLCLRGLNVAETEMALDEYRPYLMKWIFLRQKLSPNSEP